MVLIEQGLRPVASGGREGCQAAEAADYNGEGFRAELYTDHRTSTTVLRDQPSAAFRGKT
jgi:hypothetical protein